MTAAGSFIATRRPKVRTRRGERPNPHEASPEFEGYYGKSTQTAFGAMKMSLYNLLYDGPLAESGIGVIEKWKSNIRHTPTLIFHSELCLF
jgi:hypothetical protein